MKLVDSLRKLTLGTGYHLRLQELERNRVMLVNGLSVLILAICGAFLVSFILLRYSNWTHPLFAFPLYAVVLRLNIKKRYKCARVLFFYGSIFLFITWCLLNRRSGAEYSLLALGISAALIFKRTRTVYASALAAMVSFVAYQVIDVYRPFIPDPDFNYILFSYLISSVTFGVVFFQVIVFRALLFRFNKKLVRKYRIVQQLLKDKEVAEEQLHNVNQELSRSNHSLNNLLNQLDWDVKQKSRELQSYIDAINVHIYSAITDTQGTILRVNEPLSQVTGYSREELLGKNFRILNSGYHPGSFYQALYESLANGKTWRGEIRNKTKDGTIFWIDQVILPIRSEKGKLSYFLMLALPVTERKQLESERLKTIHMLESIAFRTSHKVRGPLARLIGLTHLLEKDMIEKDEVLYVARQLLESSRELDSSTRELTSYINDHHRLVNNETEK